MTLREISDITSGRLHQDDGAGEPVLGVVADSREVSPGDLFVAIAGDRVDGHDFVDQAMSLGARGVLAEREVPAPAVIVPDSLAALGQIASHVRGSLPEAKVVGVTGSSGKTTTKDLMASVMGWRGPVVAPVGSYNTELGLPLTVLTADAGTRTLVLEMGARGSGHVEYLCGIARPDVGVVLNVGSAHLGEFGSRANIAASKAELVGCLPPEGTAVLNADDNAVLAMRQMTTANVVTFGVSAGSDVRVVDVSLDDCARPTFDLEYRGKRAAVRLRLSGEHNVMNAAAAAAVGLSLGLPLSEVAQALGEAAPGKWRMQVQVTPGGVTVVNDAYNANPESMAAGLKALVSMARSRGVRCWAVLGEMRELGPGSAEAHDAIGRLAVRLDVPKLIAVGPGARAIHQAASHEGSWSGESAWVPDAASALGVLVEGLRPTDIVLVKASRAVGLEGVAEGLMADSEGRCGAS
ncbi:MAG: UDP-N-acetylmuramoyl-tripeptide--D-alanyl-D-alanine ligase [Candidatus Nanopelagicales bacterium]|nr:UDP-N-acetylmuramoyl-tripeptide--D-alanyl-D-alanine ligase [Candidatus Nanopelagicales bacterium]MDZ4248521.1 UDP-N-acetylmuramoyl-tripeptide--D-alanyl-D-alanine ligase [Candidatus Nanopelagicales bacterium]MDZ7577897.1 UDP-N-acetylmuramoyl-tripeptide--D-alanyl-D-alanine ligase [Candidatus Nanopelagicales bacterium]